MSQHDDENGLPDWLWFFIALLGVLGAALLYRRRRAELMRFEEEGAGSWSAAPSTFIPRYVEPDSIPIDVRLEGEALEDEEDTAYASAAAAAVEYEPPITQVESTRAQTGGMPEQASGDDDLTVIEGIGPAISALLKGNGITTFRALAEAPMDRLDAILTKAKLRRIADPGTWGEQSRLAAEGRWDDLKTMQQTLKAGRRTSGE